MSDVVSQVNKASSRDRLASQTFKVVPKGGDVVRYRVIPIPPKYEKYQAVQVN